MRPAPKAVLAVVVSLAIVQASTQAEVAPALGQVLQAERARLGGGAASGGATLYDGDRLLTGAAGSLRVRLGGGQLYLMPESVAAVHRSGAGARVSLERGSVLFAMMNPEGFELEALAARIRAHAAGITVGQVTVTGGNEFVVTCNDGALDVMIGDEVRTVPAESSYRVVLGSAEPQGPQGAGAPPASKRRKRIALWIAIGAGAAAVGSIPLWHHGNVSDN